MALTATTFRTLLTMFGAQFLKQENRTFEDMVSKVGIENWKRGVVDYRMENKTKEGQAVETSFLHKGQNTSQARQIDHTGPLGDSSRIAMAFTQFTRTASVEWTEGQSNDFNYQRVFENQLYGIIKDLTEEARQKTITDLLAGRSQVNVGMAKFGAFNATTDFFEILAADLERAFDYMKAMMGNNAYNGPFDLIMDSPLTSLWMELYNQGVNNAKNTLYQFNQLNPLKTEGAILGTYSYEGLIMDKESFAVTEWLPQQYQKREGDSLDNNIGIFEKIANPLVPGSELGIHIYRKQADTSATGGDVEDIVTEMQVTMYRHTAVAPLSEANASPIFGVGILPTLP